LKKSLDVLCLEGHAVGAVRRTESMTRPSGFARRTAFNSIFPHFQHFQQVFHEKLHKWFCAYCYTFNNSTSYPQKYQHQNNPENIVPRIKIHGIQHFNTPYYYDYNKLIINNNNIMRVRARLRARACMSI
jgi:hypothetical protein